MKLSNAHKSGSLCRLAESLCRLAIGGGSPAPVPLPGLGPFRAWRKPNLSEGKPNLSEGKLNLPEGKPNLPKGKPNLPEGKPNLPDGKPNLPDGKLNLPDGKLNLPEGKLDLPEGEPDLPEGEPNLPEGKADLPGGQIQSAEAPYAVSAGGQWAGFLIGNVVKVITELPTGGSRNFTSPLSGQPARRRRLVLLFRRP